MSERLILAALWVLIAPGAALYFARKGLSWQVGLLVGLVLGPGVIVVLALIPDDRLTRLLRRRVGK